MSTVDRLSHLNHIRRLSRLMDTAIRIPGIGFRIGLDPIIGLIPGLGDVVSTGISGYIFYQALRFGLPQPIIRQMLFNVGLEFVVGGIPLVGDLFDAYYKSNIRNLALLEKHLQTTEPDLEEADPLNLKSTASV